MLTNEAGEVTSHIQGMFNRTIRMLSKGVKPCYIFDGKPPQLKGGEVRIDQVPDRVVVLLYSSLSVFCCFVVVAPVRPARNYYCLGTYRHICVVEFIRAILLMNSYPT